MSDAPSSLDRGPQQVSLPEAAQAVMDVLEDCHADLAAIRHRMKQDEIPEQLDIDDEKLPSPQEQARHIAARLQAYVGSLRKAIDSDEE